MRRLICLLWGHKLGEIRRLSDVAHKMGCKRCKRIYAVNTELKMILPWNMYFEDYYRDFRNR